MVWVAFSVETPFKEVPEPTRGSIRVDAGARRLATVSTGERIANLRGFKRSDAVGVVMARTVHPRAYAVHREQALRGWTERHIVGGKPGVRRLGGENHRHAVVRPAHGAVRPGGEYPTT